MQDTQTQDTFTDLDDNMQPQPKTNDTKLLEKVLSKYDEKEKCVCGHSLDQHDISDEMMVCDIANCECDAYDGDQLSNTSKAEIAIAEARRSAIQEAIAKLKEQTSAYDRLTEKEKAQEYNKGLFDAYIEAIATLEKKPLEKASAKPTYDGVFEYVECKHCDRPIHIDVNGKWEHNHSGGFDCEVSAEPQAPTQPQANKT